MRIPPSVKNWAAAMSRRVKGRKILKNLQQEENVPDVVARRFFNRIRHIYIPGADPIKAMADVLGVSTAYILKGPDVDLGLELLVRFESLARLPDKADLRKAGVSLQRLLANPHLADIIRSLELGNRFGIVWTALEDAVSADVRNGASIPQVLDRLGITDDPKEDMYEVIYGAGEVGEPCHVPTALDAGTDHRFHPAPKGATQGNTSPCSGVGTGYPEYIHRKCKIANPNIKIH